MGRYPPSRTRGLVQVKALGEGETSHTHRVRAPAEVNRWFAAMTAEQRGELLAQVMTWQDRTRPAVLAAFSGPPASRVRQSAPKSSEGASWPAQGQREGLRPSGVVSEGLSVYALAVLTDLERGGVLVQDGDTYRLTLNGNSRPVRADTIDNLHRAGALTLNEESS